MWNKSNDIVKEMSQYSDKLVFLCQKNWKISSEISSSI